METLFRLPVTSSLADLQLNSMLGAWCDLVGHLEVATQSYRNDTSSLKEYIRSLPSPLDKKTFLFTNSVGKPLHTKDLCCLGVKL